MLNTIIVTSFTLSVLFFAAGAVWINLFPEWNPCEAWKSAGKRIGNAVGRIERK